MSRLAVIPARGGSKRIPRKNIKLFNGRPMIAYAIGAAIESGLFEEVIVSTDDDEIAEVASACGASVPFRRPPDLANDTAGTVPVMSHAADALRALGRSPELLCCIYPCVPLLRGIDLVAAHDRLVASGANFAYPVMRFHSSPFRAMRQCADGRMEFLFPEHELSRTQDLEPCFFDAGQFYWGRTDAWAQGLRMHTGGIGVDLGVQRFVDIDTPDDWLRAEWMAQALDRDSQGTDRP